MEKRKLKVDFHLHIYTSWLDKVYEAGPRDLTTLTKEFLRRGLNAATLTSFNDNRFDRLMDTAKELPYDWSIKESDIGAVVIDEQGRPFYWFNSDEKPTQRGHFLIVGNKRQTPHVKPYQQLEESLEEAQKESIFLIADHPLMLLKGTRSSGMGEENLRIFRNYFSAAEINANVRWPFFKGVNEKTRELCASIDCPIVANSDSYGIVFPLHSFNSGVFSNIGKTYNEFDQADIDLTDPYSFLQSANEAIRKYKHRPFLRSNNLLGVSQHIGYGLFYMFGKRMPFLRIRHHGGIIKE